MGGGARLPEIGPTAAWAHSTDGGVEATAALAWSLRPEVLVPLLVVAGLYMLGWRRLAGRHPTGLPWWRPALAAGGLGCIAMALLSPLDALADRSFTAHMLQHMLLMMLAVPALLLADPMPVALWALPAAARRRIGPWLTRLSLAGRAWRVATAMWLTWLAYAVTLWLWHLPAAYDAALASRVVHDAEHVTFVAGAVLFWWPVIHPAPRFRPRAPHALRVAYVILGALPTGALGLVLTLAPAVLYRTYAVAQPDAATAIADQAWGGIVMWGLGGLIDMLAVLVLVYRSLGGGRIAAGARADAPAGG